MKMSDRLYDILNKIERWLPLVSTLYVALASIWGFPYADEISQTIMAVATFLAGILEISSVAYQKAQKAEMEPLDWEGIEAELDHEDKWGGLG